MLRAVSSATLFALGLSRARVDATRAPPRLAGAVQVAAVADATTADVVGCWDNQFEGDASTIVYITAEALVLRGGAGGNASDSVFAIEDTSSFDTNSDEVDATGVSFVTQNGPDNKYNPGLYSDFDFMLKSGGDEADDLLYYCQIDYADESAAEAGKEDDDVDYLDLSKGCNGFPFSELRRTATMQECAGMDQEPGVATTIAATT